MKRPSDLENIFQQSLVLDDGGVMVVVGGRGLGRWGVGDELKQTSQAAIGCSGLPALMEFSTR